MNTVMHEAFVSAGSSISKVRRYGWKLKDTPGRLEHINKARLSIDQAYQRDSTESKVKTIARDWSWVACGALIVARRDDGLFVVDGQHRLLAARTRADIKDLPCIVFATDSVQQEAAGFLNANTGRKPLTSLQKFKALIEVKDPAAVEVQRLLTMSNYRASDDDGKRGVRCIRAMMDCVRVDKDAFQRTWPGIVAAANGETVNQRVVKGLFWLERHAAGMSLSDAKWIKRLAVVGQAALLESSAKAAAMYARGGDTVWGKGMVEIINRRVRDKFSVGTID